MLRSDLCDFRGSYIVVKGDIVLTKDKDRGFIDIRNRFLALKNNAPFVNFISKINNVLIGNLEDLDAVMPMYNLLEYSKNYWKRTSSLWNYYRDEPNNPPLNPPVGNNLPTVNCNAEKSPGLSPLNAKAIPQEKHEMRIKKIVKILSKKI